MEIKFKKLSEEAQLPTIANAGDAGMDLVCTRITQEINECGQLILVYHTDLAIEIPEGYAAFLFQRSSVSKKSLMLCNAVGIIDAGYRGEIMAKFRSTTDVVPAIYKPGERFVQLVIMPIPSYTIVEAQELSETERGNNGFGSSDKDVSAAIGSEDVQTTDMPAADSQNESGKAA